MLIKLSNNKCSYQHLDTLKWILLKPATLYTMDNAISKTTRHEADSQSSCGTTGMTNGIRAGSIACNLGELRISTVYLHPHPHKEVEKESSLQQQNEALRLDCWKKDLLQPLAQGGAVTTMGEQLEMHVSQHKSARVHRLARALAAAPKHMALKVIVTYTMMLGDGGVNLSHLGGIHAANFGCEILLKLNFICPSRM
jgi:hypothetical protein